MVPHTLDKNGITHSEIRDLGRLSVFVSSSFAIRIKDTKREDHRNFQE